eukprot:SAG31_NODE_2512_length_5584_cov_19.499727_3_plen_952_part_00
MVILFAKFEIGLISYTLACVCSDEEHKHRRHNEFALTTGSPLGQRPLLGPAPVQRAPRPTSPKSPSLSLSPAPTLRAKSPSIALGPPPGRLAPRPVTPKRRPREWSPAEQTTKQMVTDPSSRREKFTSVMQTELPPDSHHWTKTFVQTGAPLQLERQQLIHRSKATKDHSRPAAATEGRIAELAKTVRELETKKQQLAHESETAQLDLRHKLAIVTTDKESLQTALASSVAENRLSATSSRSEIASLVASHRTAAQQHAEAIAAMAAEHSAAAAAAAAAVASAAAELHAAKESAAGATAGVSELHVTSSEKDTQIAELAQTVSRLELERKQLLYESRVAEALIGEMESELDHSSGAKDGRIAELAKTVRELETKKQQLAHESETAQLDLRHKLAIVTTDKESLQTALASSVAENRLSATSSRSEIASLVASHRTAAQQHAEAIAAMAAEPSAAAAAAAAAVALSAAELHAAKESAAGATAGVSELHVTSSEKDTQIAELAQTVSRLELEREQLLYESETAQSDMRHKLAIVTTDKESLQTALASSVAENRLSATSSRSEIASLVASHRTAAQQHAEAIAAMAVEHSAAAAAAAAAVASAAAELHAAKESAAGATAGVSELHVTSSEKDTQIAELAQTVSRLWEQRALVSISALPANAATSPMLSQTLMVASSPLSFSPARRQQLRNRRRKKLRRRNDMNGISEATLSPTTNPVSSHPVDAHAMTEDKLSLPKNIVTSFGASTAQNDSKETSESTPFARTNSSGFNPVVEHVVIETETPPPKEVVSDGGVTESDSADASTGDRRQPSVSDMRRSQKLQSTSPATSAGVDTRILQQVILQQSTGISSDDDTISIEDEVPESNMTVPAWPPTIATDLRDAGATEFPAENTNPPPSPKLVAKYSRIQGMFAKQGSQPDSATESNCSKDRQHSVHRRWVAQRRPTSTVRKRTAVWR